MQNSKLVYLKRVLSIVLIIVLFVVVNSFLGEKLEPVSYAVYFNHDLEEIEKNNQDIDLLFVGASRTYRTLDPRVFEEKLGYDCVLNAGSSAQPINGTYYQLKDIVERCNVKRVMIGVTFDQLSSNKGFVTQSNLIVYDRLSSKNKVSAAFNVFKGEKRLYLLNLYRFRNNIDCMDSIAQEKQTVLDNNYVETNWDDEYYAGAGFVYSTVSIPTGNVPININDKFSYDTVSKEKLDYLDKCIKLCKDNNIEVNLVTAPTTVMRLYGIENYQDAIQFYTDYAEKNGIKYYNLNYLIDREEFLPDELMKDYNHVNGEGGILVSERFCDVLLKSDAGVDYSQDFYANLDEFKKTVHRIVAVDGEIEKSEDGTTIMHATSFKNDDVVPVYKVLIKGNDEQEYTTLVDWTKDKDIVLDIPYEKDYSIKLIAGSESGQEKEAFQVYYY